MSDYGYSSYWDERYSYHPNDSYDWYQDYSTLKDYLHPYLSKGKNDLNFEILIPGCGNSTLSEEIYKEGFVNITSIDISSVVISQMRDRCAHLDEMEYTVMDALNMEYIPEECFDLIIDKGLFDSQLCTQKNITNIRKLINEMYRVLKPGGTYIVISHGPPDNRLGYLQRSLPWKVNYQSIEKQQVHGYENENEDEWHKYHYIYTCTK
uniref:Methyltransferase domain-containing protein n=1 Tax=Chromulina nebulosa TaxID=96789 RepID=A0A7S0SX50_9STRA|mmetsp:Transcript_678/g.590  ORF Transcript_678/g.590 Transcript_678/m.590 type:complete len:208 (+) Transcript_678:8-631(+)